MLRRSIRAYAFLAFPLAVLFVFTLAPTVGGLALSLFQWDGGTAPQFVGAANYRLLLDDPRFIPSLLNTLLFVVVTVPLTMFLGFLLALALHAQWFRGKTIVRTAIGFVWRWLLDDQGGLLPATYNGVVGALETMEVRPFFLPLSCPSLLQDGYWPMICVMAVSIWRGVGFAMVLYLAALAAIPEHLYEAGAVDGAESRDLVRHITWPMVAPMTIFLLVTGVISGLQVFDIVWSLTAGTETAATRVLNLFVYREFEQSRLGYAAAIGTVLFALTLIATAAQLMLFRRTADEREGAPA